MKLRKVPDFIVNKCLNPHILFFLHQAFNTIAHPIQQAQAANYKIQNRVLDISNVDVSIQPFEPINYLCAIVAFIQVLLLVFYVH